MKFAEGRAVAATRSPSYIHLGFRGSYKWGYKSPKVGDKYSSPTYNYP